MMFKKIDLGQVARKQQFDLPLNNEEGLEAICSSPCFLMSAYVRSDRPRFTIFAAVAVQEIQRLNHGPLRRGHFRTSSSVMAVYCRFSVLFTSLEL